MGRHSQTVKDPSLASPCGCGHPSRARYWVGLSVYGASGYYSMSRWICGQHIEDPVRVHGARADGGTVDYICVVEIPGRRPS